MKNIKKISLISFLACASLAGGILMANTDVEEPVETPYFKMENGAQIRVPDEVDGKLVKDGLRFTATMSDSFWKEKGEMDKLSVGMFIMPAIYADADHQINYDNCFGEKACYYWDGVEAKTEKARKILNVESYAYEEVEGVDYLTMKASVWNLDEDNLAMEYVAVAYLTNGTDYWFAKTGDGAKAVSVAQKALLDTEDEIYAEEGAAKKVEEAYVDVYLNGGKEISYTENLYVEKADGTYEKQTATKTVEVTSYNTLTSSEVPEGYVWANGLAPAEVILLSGETEVDVYANIPAKESLVLFDGTDSIRPLPDRSYLDANTDFALGDKFVGTYKTPWDSVFEGEYGWIYNQANNSWGGPAWSTALQLPFATNTFSYVARFVADTTKHGSCYIYSKWSSSYQLANSIKARAIGEADWTTFALDAGGFVIFTEEFPCFKADVTYEFEVTVPNAIATFAGIFWKINPGEAGVLNNFGIDNVCMVDTREPELVSARISVPYTYTGTSGISFTPWTYNMVDDAKTPISLNAVYRVAGAEDWSDADPDGDGVCDIATTSGNLYQVKVTNAEYGFEEILEIREGMLMTNFNGDEGDDVITVTTSGAYKVENEFSGVGAIVDGCSGMALKLASNGYIQRKHNSAFNLGGNTVDKIGFYAYANGGESFKDFLYPYNPGAYFVAEANYTCDGVAATTFSAGWHYYEADVTDTAEWTHIWFATRATVYIDAMLFIF